MNTTHEYTNEQIQAAIDAAFPQAGLLRYANIETRPGTSYWPQEAPNRLAIARAFLAALPKPSHRVEPDQKADPYARLKAYNEAGARIRCGIEWAPIDVGWSTRSAWQWSEPVDQYEVHPDDLHMVPEYAPKPQAWTMPAPPPGRRWHREDWTADMLPEGYRPLLDGEVIDKEDEFYYCGVGPWKSAIDASGYASGKRVDGGAVHFRTCRPLPAEASAEPEKPGHGPQEASKADEPDTFEAHGKTWTRHMPGDPCPCDPEANIELLLAGGRRYEGQARFQSWGQIRNNPDNAIIGWRHADEPAQAEAANTDTEWNEYQQELMSPLPKPWTPRPGDVVRLKSGGPKMAVDTVAEPDEHREGQLVYGCFWIAEDGRPQAFKLPAVLLQPAD